VGDITRGWLSLHVAVEAGSTYIELAVRSRIRS
jgi:hypothetical protein